MQCTFLRGAPTTWKEQRDVLGTFAGATKLCEYNRGGDLKAQPSCWFWSKQTGEECTVMLAGRSCHLPWMGWIREAFSKSASWAKCAAPKEDQQ